MAVELNYRCLRPRVNCFKSVPPVSERPDPAPSARTQPGPVLRRRGRAALRFPARSRRFAAGCRRNWPDPVAIFGAGHVGQALVRTCCPCLSRCAGSTAATASFRPGCRRVQTEQSDPVQLAVPGCFRQPGADHELQSHRDFGLVAACLRRLRASDDLPFVGLIGSQSSGRAFANGCSRAASRQPSWRA